jgi:hypothetical protein
MTEFLDILLSFPTVAFTVPLGLTLLYWLLVIFGGADVDMLDGGAGGALDGAADGALDGAVDGALDGAADGALDGVVDGGVDGAAEGIDLDHAGDALGSFSAVAMLAAVLRLGRVPATFALSAFLLWGWSVSFLLTWGWRHGWILPVPAALFGAVTLLGASVGGALLTNLTVRPFEVVFKKERMRTRADLFGEVCTLRTSHADAGFGHAELTVDHDVLRIEVRCDRPNNAMARGDEALIVSYDEARRAYVVEPMHAIEGELLEAAERRRQASRARRGISS